MIVRAALPNLAIILAFPLILAASANGQASKCLPPDIKEDTVVGWDNPVNSERPSKPITVKQTLSKLKARCSRGKLVDRRGKKIRFFQLQGCWGTPPPGYADILLRQKQEIADLRKKFTVVEVTCNASGMPIY